MVSQVVHPDHAQGLECMSRLCIAVLLLPSRACHWTHQRMTALVHDSASDFAQPEGYQERTNLRGGPEGTGMQVKHADTTIAGS